MLHAVLHILKLCGVEAIAGYVLYAVAWGMAFAFSREVLR